MDTTLAITSIVVINFLAWLSPGPNMVLVISTSVQHGRVHGFAVAAGLAGASLLWASLAMLGVAVLFRHAPSLVTALKLVGVAYLSWLGIKLLRSAFRDASAADLQWRPPSPSGASFLTGFLVSMTNPNAAFFFGSILSAFVPADSSVAFKVFVVVLCGALGLVLHGVTALVFSSPMIVRGSNLAKAKINVLFGVVLIWLAGLVAYDLVFAAYPVLN
ncbi:LysE family transporter [Rhodobacter sphaeroides]|jgi:threonine/homoserine/homoserine lactone efflux protein|uniref:Threonine efflux protein n=1 Tax=Cereibacter sphaeroides (strain ATCC 17023 / DSM 158 / JCM 6121 / CCUG 31486 / LMG 2827 / NBRC 12203 / NCIMB 8253 / ATH 2.4.1.) TaxID=272943 RepID=Q3IV17_CERS4|nr:LysE family translocator [Cereibacter sphaeroides]ABA81617.1 Putative threonine efflux protein [Cereibacter sphaeroides 2.4.1]AMJ49759.1 threonine transporter [Cereibacter sphaeroides]ANS36521.1 threonine transporter [Cereibacter sphaeroides]ATN65533.1 threonine transporter [Cereibacter sphaeroides]AXC64148.1 LysE family translocator [Cereibacter sphaeroides 2.4.1]